MFENGIHFICNNKFVSQRLPLDFTTVPSWFVNFKRGRTRKKMLYIQERKNLLAQEIIEKTILNRITNSRIKNTLKQGRQKSEKEFKGKEVFCVKKCHLFRSEVFGKRSSESQKRDLKSFEEILGQYLG